jgi:hypothetical protein
VLSIFTALKGSVQFKAATTAVCLHCIVLITAAVAAAAALQDLEARNLRNLEDVKTFQSIILDKDATIALLFNAKDKHDTRLRNERAKSKVRIPVLH